MEMPWKKKPVSNVNLEPVAPKLRTVSELVTSFTTQFKEVADRNAKVVETQEAIIKAATDKKNVAATEKQDAENFIANFEAMRKPPVVK